MECFQWNRTKLNVSIFVFYFLSEYIFWCICFYTLESDGFSPNTISIGYLPTGLGEILTSGWSHHGIWHGQNCYDGVLSHLTNLAVLFQICRLLLYWLDTSYKHLLQTCYGTACKHLLQTCYESLHPDWSYYVTTVTLVMLKFMLSSLAVCLDTAASSSVSRYRYSVES